MSSSLHGPPGGGSWRIHPARAILHLGGFALSTTVAYLIFELFLRGLSAELLTFGIFVSFFLYHLTGPQDRRSMLSWRPEVSLTTVQHSFFCFMYWYCFWTGMQGTESSIGMAFIALTMVVTPLGMRFLRGHMDAAAIRKLVVIGFALVAAILLMKANADSLGLVIASLAAMLSYPALCMILAVLAETAQEVVRAKVADQIEDEAERRNVIDHILLASMVPCIAYAALLLILRSEWNLFSTGINNGLVALIWYAILIFLATIFGTVARTKLIAPLVSVYRLDYESIPPFLALRPILFFALAIVISFLLEHVVGYFPAGSCVDSVCTFRSGTIHLHTNIVITPRDSYWVGIAIVAVVFVLRLRFFIKYGFSTDDQRRFLRGPD